MNPVTPEEEDSLRERYARATAGLRELSRQFEAFGKALLECSMAVRELVGELEAEDQGEADPDDPDGILAAIDEVRAEMRAERQR